MSPDKKSQKGNLGRRPGSFFNIFNENEQIATNTTADPSVATLTSPAVVAAEAVIPGEQTALSQAIADAGSAEPEAETDTRLLGEKAPLAIAAVAVTTDTDTTISDFDLVNQEIANSRTFRTRNLSIGREHC